MHFSKLVRDSCCSEEDEQPKNKDVGDEIEINSQLPAFIVKQTKVNGYPVTYNKFVCNSRDQVLGCQTWKNLIPYRLKSCEIFRQFNIDRS